MKSSDTVLTDKISALPEKPGCYLYLDSDSQIIYVGKAVNLKKRVNSYFQKNQTDLFIQNLVKDIHDLRIVITANELEALLLETNLIKLHSPKYNRDLKDDKNYIWLEIDYRQDFPEIKIVRDKKKHTQITYLGPYPNTIPIKRILKSIRKIYPYRSCKRVIEYRTNSDGEKYHFSSDRKPCLYYHLGMCQAPCADKVSRKEYRSNIQAIGRYFSKGKHDLVRDLKEEMNEAATQMNYELAAKLRDRITDLEFVSKQILVDSGYDEIRYRRSQEKSNLVALNQLKDKLDFFSFPQKENFRIECYDISNIQGTNAVGSMVVFIDGKPDKSMYRKFKIKTKTTPDDFYMLQEVMTRRIKNFRKGIDKSFAVPPDLIIIDGGKGQLSSVYKILNEQEIDWPVVGLAKKQEEIFMPDDSKGELRFLIRKLRSGTPGFFLLQRIRDESHRFAINYHRKLRSFGQKYSLLDDIPGVGKVTKKRLLQAFGSVAGIKRASEADINTIIKNKTTAAKIKKILSTK